MTKDELIAFLTKFRSIDKYKTFYRILPEALWHGSEQQQHIADLLDACAALLLKHYEQNKRPYKTTAREIIQTCMDDIARLSVTPANKDFGYELCWYIGEKAGIDLRKSSSAKIWGYWAIDGNKVRSIGSIRRKKISKPA